MPETKITLGLKRVLCKSIFTLVLTLLLISISVACNAPSPTTTGAITKSPILNEPVNISTAPPTTIAEAIRPQGELVAALQTFGNENFLPWLDPSAAPLDDLVYDMLIYWDHINYKFIPGLAESWEISPDGITLTYHLRKGVQWQDGWGEFTSADVKYNFEMQASPKSVGKVSQCRRITNMETPDPHTLVVHFKDSYPTFWMDLSIGNSGICQGIVCKKYVETVGEDAASQKPIGTGPYQVIASQSGSSFKFEALESHWRVVPEFKTLTVRLLPETSTLVAALKNREIDLAQVPVEQLTDLKAAGVTVEVSPLGGGMLVIRWGGIVISADKRYDPAYHNKEPWIDVKVRKAMATSIDRDAISKAIFAGSAKPAGVPLNSADMDKYQYSYDPVAAKQLLKDAGYPNGFSFKVISYLQPGVPESARLMEALAGYWKQIGLDPQLVVIDLGTYNSKNVTPLKMAGEVSLYRIAPVADMLSRYELFLMPNVTTPLFEDEGSLAIYNNATKTTFEERRACVDQLNQYYFENVGPIPVVRAGYCFAWNSEKISPWPHHESPAPVYYEYVRHAKPTNTFRLFSPWPDR